MAYDEYTDRHVITFFSQNLFFSSILFHVLNKRKLSICHHISVCVLLVRSQLDAHLTNI